MLRLFFYDFLGQWSHDTRSTPNDEKEYLGIRVGGGGSYHALTGSLGAIAEGRTHPTSVYFQRMVHDTRDTPNDEILFPPPMGLPALICYSTRNTLGTLWMSADPRSSSRAVWKLLSFTSWVTTTISAMSPRMSICTTDSILTS